MISEISKSIKEHCAFPRKMQLIFMYHIGSITEEDESLEESQASLKLEDAVTTLQNFEKSVNLAIEAFKGRHRF